MDKKKAGKLAAGAVAALALVMPWLDAANKLKALLPSSPSAASPTTPANAASATGEGLASVIQGDGNVVAHSSTVIVLPPSGRGENGEPSGHGQPQVTTNLLLGTWSSDYRYATSLGTRRVAGRVQYFRNGTYAFSGEIETDATHSAHAYHAVHSATAAGKWQLRDGYLMVELVDMKSALIKLTFDGVSVDPRDSPKVGVEADMPRGRSEDFRVVGVTSDEMVLEAEQPGGGKFLFSSHKLPST